MLLTALQALLLLGWASTQVQGCYYSALNLENPNDYYYRYCQIGVSSPRLTPFPSKR
jgi:hypothetical protein